MRAFLLLALLASVVSIQTPAQAGEIKNSESILGGALTRAGNTGRAQLNDSQLEALCEKGYTNAYFLYSGAQARTVRCGRGQIEYRSQSINNMAPIIADIAQGVKGGGKTFVHCNNGAHASGLVAAVALKQFCGYSSDAAFKYWSNHLNGYALQPENMAGIKRRINSFGVSSGMSLSAGDRARLCN